MPTILIKFFQFNFFTKNFIRRICDRVEYSSGQSDGSKWEIDLEIISLLLLGAVAGTLAGLLGVGGGVVIVPVLLWIFHSHADIPTVRLMQMAIGTTMATIVITSISSIVAHHRYSAVLWTIVWQLVPGIIVGALLGAILANALSSDTLQTVFAVFILLASAQMGLRTLPYYSFFTQAFSKTNHNQSQSRLTGTDTPSTSQEYGERRSQYQAIENPYPLPNRLGMGIMGAVIGTISALVGIGGGSFIVPFLVGYHIPIRNAVATSAACGFPLAVSGAAGFMLVGWQISELPAFSSGYIYWPALAAIAPMSLLFAPLGAKLAHTISKNLLKKFFAVFLVIVGINML